ncbi:TlpA family protein disulfide reductase [Pseudoalteromonas mariniglutinosa]|uniref:TlpA family protein disulfide reductase n=1 Tax=Pseudoalteromonas mariniglutinosa TaxID=206042 RepID=UPI00384C295C
MKKLISLLLNIIVLALVIFAVTTFQQRNLLSSDRTAAPYFNLANLEQPTSRVTIAQLQGKRTVLYFFAPWCSICRYSMPNLERAFKAREVNAIAIALDYETPQAVQAFSQELELTMPVLLGSSHTRQDYKVSAYPTYYVLDEELNIISRSMGYSTLLGLKFRAMN